MSRAPPAWLESLSRDVLLLSFACAALLAGVLVRRPQKMAIMNAVWPLTALYAGPLALAGYFVLGRRQPKGERPLPQASLLGATHCGAGCTLGDIIGDWLVFATGATLFGSDLGARFAVGSALAYVFGIAFQYFSIAPMRGLGLKQGLIAAIKADTLSLAAFQIGMFAWMAISAKLLFPGLKPISWTYWLMMQIAMLLGLITAWPVNAWLITKGLKERM